MSFSEKIGSNINLLKLPRYLGQVLTKSDSNYYNLPAALNDYARNSLGAELELIIKHQANQLIASLGNQTRRFVSLKGFSELYDKAFKAAPFEMVLENISLKVDSKKLLENTFTHLARELSKTHKNKEPYPAFAKLAMYQEMSFHGKLTSTKHTVSEIKDLFLEAISEHTKNQASEDIQKASSLFDKALKESMCENIRLSPCVKEIKNDMIDIFSESLGANKLVLKIRNDFSYNDDKYYLNLIGDSLKSNSNIDANTSKIFELFSQNLGFETSSVVMGRKNTHVSMKTMNKLLLNDIHVLYDNTSAKGAVLWGDQFSAFGDSGLKLSEISSVRGAMVFSKTKFTAEELTDAIHNVKAAIYDVFILNCRANANKAVESKNAR